MTDQALIVKRRVRFRQVHVHQQVADTAHALCHGLYDDLMRNDVLWAEWKHQNPGLSAKGLENLFVARNMSKCIPIARATLATMLNGPYDEAFKTRVHEALCLDATLMRGRGRSPIQ